MITSLLSILQTLVEWDTHISLALNGWHTGYWDHFMELITDRFIWIPFYVALVWGIFRQIQWKYALICLFSALVLLIINDQLCSSVIRQVVCRLRPSNLDNPISSFVYVVNEYRGGRFGFPSAHATNCWGLVFFMIYVFRRLWLSLIMVVWALLVCYSRIYLGVHYLGDLLGGMLLALVNASIVFWLLKYYCSSTVCAARQYTTEDRITKYSFVVCCTSIVIMLLFAVLYNPDTLQG